MSVELDRFSILKAPKQARTLQKLWSEAETPPPEDTRRRYRDYPHALGNVVRLAWAGDYESYIVYKRDEERRGRVAIGTASIIFGAGLVRVGDGEVYRGNDLDYRFAGEQDDERLHFATAKALVYESSRRELGRTGTPPKTVPGTGDASVSEAVNKIIATTPAGADYNRGLHAFTQPEGEETRYLDFHDADIPEIAPEEPAVLYAAQYFVRKAKFKPMEVVRNA